MINPEHLAMLAASGITPEHAELRGYETTTDAARLHRLKFAAAGCNVPGLLIPLLRADATVWGHQYRPDSPRTLRGKITKYENPPKQRNGLDVPPGVGPMLANPSIPLWFTEGIRKADSGAVAGLCIAGLTGVWNWRCTNEYGGKTTLPEFREIAFNEREVIIAFDSDIAQNLNVAQAARELGAYCNARGARVQYLYLPDGGGKTGLDDYLGAGNTIDELSELVCADEPGVPRRRKPQAAPKPAKPAPPTYPPISLAATHQVFIKWLGGKYDTDALDAMLATLAAEQLDGDPVWLLIISGSAAAKTETVQAATGVGAIVVSSIASEAALLSATPEKDRAEDATGGLLCEVGDSGVLVIKDVTSILSMDRKLRDAVLSALREIYDGNWSRRVGLDGGRIFPWKGRIAVIGAVTTAWDSAREAISKMGDRFVLIRVDSTVGRIEAGRKAIANTGSETVMRAELSAAVGGVIAGMNCDAITLDAAETDTLLKAADLVTLVRTAVEHDYRGDVIDSHAPEMPTRFPKELAQIMRGACAIGADRAEALRLAIRCARDSMPPLRLAIIDDLVAHQYDKSPDGATPTEVRRRLGKPRATVDRQLQALHTLGVVELTEVPPKRFDGQPDPDGKPTWRYRLSAEISPEAIQPTVTRNVSEYPQTSVKEEKSLEAELEKEKKTNISLRTPTHISGNGQVAACVDGCGNLADPGDLRCSTCAAIHRNIIAGYDQ